MKFEAVLFDLDGTLLDTLVDLADSANAALVQLGFATHPVEAYKYFIGEGIENLVRKILPKGHLDGATVNKCAAIAKEEYARRWSCNSRPYPGIGELLIALEKRGIAKAVLSNKPDEFTKIMVAKLLPDRNFEVVRGALPDVPIKPDPTAALEIAKEMAIPQGSFICLGDSNIDMQTANSAGMYAVGALWGFRDAEELLASGAKVLVKEPQEVFKLIVS